jgi:hypothetical protein
MNTIEEIIKYSQEGQLEKWVDEFLRGEGKNIPFADGLKKEKRYWYGPIEFPLNKLTRCCGPEEEMRYKVSQEHWERKTGEMRKHIESGGEFPPLIAEYKNKILTVNDGNHRMGAYEKLGLKKAWIIFWCSSEKDFGEMKDLLEHS